MPQNGLSKSSTRVSFPSTSWGTQNPMVLRPDRTEALTCTKVEFLTTIKTSGTLGSNKNGEKVLWMVSCMYVSRILNSLNIGR